MEITPIEIPTNYQSEESCLFCDSHQDSIFDEVFLNFSDKVTPLVVLFGVDASGKTSVLVRLSKYLRDMGYSISPNESLRPSYVKQYKYACRHYDEIMNLRDLNLWHYLGFMLIDVRNSAGRKICQIVDIPGQFCYDYNLGERGLGSNPVLQEIFATPNPKVWLLITELDWGQPLNIREMYARQIGYLKSNFNIHDKSIVLVNKIDCQSVLFNKHGKVDSNLLMKELRQQYPSILKLFRRKTVLLRLFDTYDCRIVAFNSGAFFKHLGEYKIIIGQDEYPKRLWESITRYLKL